MQTSMIKLLKPADFISMINAGFGFIAILLLSYDSNDQLFIHLSFSFILLALLADGLDGIVARRTEKGILGEYFEAMADMISMGIAPAFFVFLLYKSLMQSYYFLLIAGFILVLLFYILSCTIRLAAFHPLKSACFFTGLPASAATILIISSVYLGFDLFLIILIVVIVSLLMISSVSFPKPSKIQNIISTGIIFLNVFLGMFYNHLFVYVLLLSVLIYILVGPLLKTKKYNM